MHRFGPGLCDVQRARLAILGPFEVHGYVVVFFDRHGPMGQLVDLRIAQHELLTPFLWCVDVHRTGARTVIAGGRQDHGLLLRAQLVL